MYKYAGQKFLYFSLNVHLKCHAFLSYTALDKREYLVIIMDNLC